MERLAILILSLLLAACGAMPAGAPPARADLFADAAFGAPTEPVGAADLFTLSPAMLDYLHSRAFSAQLRVRGAEQGLVDALYKKGGLGLKLEYESNFTRNAAQTFEARRGNCLSLVIMTAAFARELGMTVQYNNVLAGQHWMRTGDIYLTSTHVNLSVARRPPELMRNTGPQRMYTIDFLPPEDVAAYRSTALEEDEIRAMYLNNRAVEALLGNRIDDAYWWARAALAQQPSFLAAYNTLGVIFQRHGNPQQAERVLRAALEREPDNLLAMQNLVPVLAAAGKVEESAALARRLAALDPQPPYHFFNLGMAAMQAGEFKSAQALFMREVRRAPYNDEFHFWLAIASLRIGETGRAREQLALALDTSTTGASRERYAAKLAQLRAQAPPASGAH